MFFLSGPDPAIRLLDEGMSDQELLRAYATEGSEAAFTELVRRHAGSVEAAAFRQTGDSGLAEDVTHAVFLLLARKAGSLGPKVLLLGWLLRATRYAAIDAVRAEARRQRREAEFFAMQSLEPNLPDTESESLWSRVAPLLDEALLRLRESDRTALLLRFFENKPLAAVGAALGVPEDAARKRVDRALARLQARLRQRGAFASLAVLPTLLDSHAAPVSKASLVQTTTHAALSPVGPSAADAADSLAVMLRRRMFWATARPWLAAAALLVAGSGSWAGMSRGPTRTPGESGLVDDDYRIAGFPDARVVRGFVADFQQGLGADHRLEVTRLVKFPLRVNSPRGTEFIPDKEVLLARYDAVFSPQVIGSVLKSPNHRLFCSVHGVMVGDGTVWIAPAGGTRHPQPYIIALNLP